MAIHIPHVVCYNFSMGMPADKRSLAHRLSNDKRLSSSTHLIVPIRIILLAELRHQTSEQIVHANRINQSIVNTSVDTDQ